VADNAGRFFAGAGVRGVIRGGLVVGTSLNSASARAPFRDDGGGDQTPVAFATYNSTFSMLDNTVVGFPLEPGQRSGAFATEDYYIRPVERGHTFNRGNLLVASHPGARLRAALPHYTLSGALWDPHGTWGVTPGCYLVYDQPFFTFGQTPEVPAPGAVDVGAVAVAGPFYGLGNFTINQDRPSYSPLMALAVQRLDPGDPSQVVGTFSVDAAVNEHALLANMRHFAAHRDGLYALRFPGHARPRELEVRVSNMLESSDRLVVALEFDGGTTPSAVMARVYRTHTDFAYTAVGSLAALRASDGETYWQDHGNNLIWVHLRGGRWTAHWDQTDNYEPTADDDEDSLYEPIVLRVVP
jgi:hypothetical protein